MNKGTDMQKSTTHPGKEEGFTLIELLVVIAIIALLLSIIMPALSRAKLYAQRVMCSNNIRQQSLGTLLYSNDNDSSVPKSQGGSWLWDMSIWSTNQMSKYAGFDDLKTFFCPANKIKQWDDARFTQFSILYATGKKFPNPVPHPYENETTMSTARQQGQFRVLPNIYMFDKFDSSGNSWLPDRLITGEEARWITKFSKIQSTGSKVMIMDVVISAMNSYNFFNIETGGIWDMTDHMVADNSNHASRQVIHSGGGTGTKPDGSNIGYADGHTDWRRFEVMQHRLTIPNGPWFWW